MKIKNYHGRTGAGKSRKMKANIIIVKGRHLLVVPRKNSIRECYDDLMKLAQQAGMKINIHKFLRDDRTKRYSTKIAKEIIDCADRYQDDEDHCCLIITQAAFQQIDLSHFEGWHLKLDELLTNGNPSGVLFAPIMWAGSSQLHGRLTTLTCIPETATDGPAKTPRSSPGFEPNASYVRLPENDSVKRLSLE